MWVRQSLDVPCLPVCLSRGGSAESEREREEDTEHQREGGMEPTKEDPTRYSVVQLGVVPFLSFGHAYKYDRNHHKKSRHETPHFPFLFPTSSLKGALPNLFLPRFYYTPHIHSYCACLFNKSERKARVGLTRTQRGTNKRRWKGPMPIALTTSSHTSEHRVKSCVGSEGKTGHLAATRILPAFCYIV